METVAASILSILHAHGVRHAFGVPGGAVSPFYAALGRDIHYTNARHETNAVFMAMGAASATERPTLVLTTAGPGFTNALTGLAASRYEGLPVICIAGDVPRSSRGRGALQDSSGAGLDALAMARGCGRAAELAHPASALATVRATLDTRGPTIFLAPLDVSGAGAPPSRVWTSTPAPQPLAVEAWATAAAALDTAPRPFLLAGAGARGARAALRELAERLQCPVAVTPKAKDVFPEDHPLALGVFGYGGHESVTAHLRAGIDALLVVGSGLDDVATNGWSDLLNPRGALIQIDPDPSALGRAYRVDIGLCTRAEDALPELFARVHPRRPQSFAVVRQAMEPSARGLLTTAEVMDALNHLAPPGVLYTGDMGEHLSIALHYLRLTEGTELRTCMGLGSMGSSIGFGIGHALARPDRHVYIICGDGGALMSGNELATAAQLGLPVTMVILNDSRFNMCHHGMCDLYGATPDLGTPPTNFARWAEGLGARGTLVETRSQLAAALAAPGGTRVLDIRVDPDVRLRGSQRNATLRQFKEGAPA